MAIFRACILCLVLTGMHGISAIALPQKLDLPALNQQLASTMVAHKIRSAVVVDFHSDAGQPSTLGWYLADELSEFWFKKKPKFRVLDRSQLTDTKVPPEDLRSAEMVKRLGSVWGVDAIVSGVVKLLPDGYALNVRVSRVFDNSEVATASLAIPHSPAMDLLQPVESAGSEAKMYRAGVQGVSVPRCLFCPIPSYSERARAAKIQGTIILSVLISSEGRSLRIRILKPLGFGLTQKAIENVSHWKFSPATTLEGEPVPVIVPIEVTFRIN